MERQKLMEGSEKGVGSVGSGGETRKNNNKSREQCYSLIESGRSEVSDRLCKKEKVSSLMDVFSDLFGGKTSRRHSRLSLSTTVVLVLGVLSSGAFSGVDSSPVNPKLAARQNVLFNMSPSARNIRHLPCVSRRTKQEGICMFAIDCLKANGTHLGTCIDRFYFGSCCQMPEDVPPIVDNNIDDNSIYEQSFRKPVKGDQEDKLESGLNSLSSSIPQAQSTSHKVVVTTPSSLKITKPTRPSLTRQPTTTTESAHRISSTTTRSPSQRPTFISNRPPFAPQKYGSTPQKLETTTKQEIIEPTLHTKRPHPSSITRRPITTGVIVNNTIYTKPALNDTKITVINITKGKDPIQPTQFTSNVKPIRNTTTQNAFASTALSLFSTTPASTTPPKTFYLPSRYTTTQKPKNITGSFSALGSTTTEKLVTTQYIQETRRTTTKQPETTTPSSKFSTFYSILDEETKKPTIGTKKPITGKPTPSPNLGPHLPFGTRLPSGSSSSLKPSTSTSNKPSIFTSNKPSTVTFNNPSTSTSNKPSTFISIKPSTISQTTTKPSSDVTDTVPPIILTPTRPTHKPIIQKPTVSQRPEKPTTQLNTSKTTERPLVQRPQNSTLSNRRPTIKPTTVTKKPENGTSETINKLTTVIYKPTVETRPSLKPTIVSQKPSDETQKPTTSITFRPSTIYNRRPITADNSTNDTVTTSPKPVDVSYKPSSSWYPTKKPVPSTSTLNQTKEKPTSPAQSTTLSDITASSIAPTSTTSRPISSFKPSTITKKPLVKPSSTIIPVKPSTSVTKKPVVSSKPTINQIDGVVSQKPTTIFGQKPLVTTTENIGLVTWTNYVEPAVTSSPQSASTIKDENLTPSEGWVMLQTIAPPNGSVSTIPPANTISSSYKPVATRPTPSKKPYPSTTAPESSTSKTETTTRYSTLSAIQSSSTSETATKASSESSSLRPTIQTVKEPGIQTSRKPVFEMTTRTPIIESTTKTTTEAFITKPVITIHVTTKPLQKPESSNITENSEMEFTTFMSVSGGPTAKPSVTVTQTNVSTSAFEEATEIIAGLSAEQENTTTAQSETTVESSTSAGDGNATSSSGTTSAMPNTTASIISTESLNMSDFRDVCGRRLWPEARVVGGSKANFGRWPWQVSLRQWRTSTYLHKCGAALLSENWAITAAHCVDNVAPSDLLLRLGEHDLASEDEPYGYQERRVQIVASHPQFDPRTFEYDLALLRFYEPVNFQPNILPVCVPTNDEGFVGKSAYVTGWGRLYEDGPLPSVLQEVRVPVLENEACEQMYRAAGYIEHIPHIFICAGWRNGGFDSCEGDSGGPLVLQRDDNRFQLAGIISWGIGCAEPNQPGVYTRISEFRDWINQILQF